LLLLFAALIPFTVPTSFWVALWNQDAFSWVDLAQPPLLEETLFRGIVLTLLLKRFPAWFALLWAAVLFMPPHLFEGPALMLENGLVFGVTQGILRLRTRSIWPGVVAHYVLLTLRTSYSPAGSRFLPAGSPASPRRRCPCQCMVVAALWSRCRLVPQSGQECQRTDKPLWTTAPHPEHVWLVNAGSTAGTRFPALAALKVRRARNALQPASAMLLAREWVRTRLATRTSSW
jgi:hypothetical protein